MPNIDITIKNKIASGVPGQFVVCGNSDFTIRFSFDSEWDSYNAKTARFIWAEGFEDVNFTGSDCPMPVIANTNNVVIGVYAGEQLHTTTPAVVVAKKSILCGNAESSHTIITKGAKGDPGVSPAISVTDITGGHRVTIVDAEHGIEDPITFDVMDGDAKVVEIFASPGKSAYTASELRAMIGTYHFYFDSNPVSFIWYEGDENKTKFSVLVGGENQLSSILYSVDESKNLVIVSMTNAVPDTRKVNNKALSSDITITEADIPNLEDHLQEINDEITEARQDVTQALTNETTARTSADTALEQRIIPLEQNELMPVRFYDYYGEWKCTKTYREIKAQTIPKCRFYYTDRLGATMDAEHRYATTGLAPAYVISVFFHINGTEYDTEYEFQIDSSNNVTLIEHMSQNHTHSNKSVLDDLSDDNNKLKYKGVEIGITGAEADAKIATAVQNEATARQNADGELQSAITALQDAIDGVEDLIGDGGLNNGN